MAYLRPPAVVHRLFNPIAMRLGAMGVATLEVAGRSTDAVQKVPVIPVDHDGERYLVSTRGESEWVRNLRATGEGTLHRKGGAERFRAREVDIDERPPILATYRKVAGRAVRGYFRKLPDPADHPVFRVEPSS